IGAQGAAAASVLGPAEHTGLEERAIDDQLPAALEQLEQTHSALGSVELVLLGHSLPRHAPTLGGQRVTGVGQFLLLHEQLLAGSLPLLRRNDRGCLHCNLLLFVDSGPTLVRRLGFRRFACHLMRATAACRTCRGGATRSPSRCATCLSGRASDTCPRGRPPAAHTPNRY